VKLRPERGLRRSLSGAYAARATATCHCTRSAVSPASLADSPPASIRPRSTKTPIRRLWSISAALWRVQYPRGNPSVILRAKRPPSIGGRRGSRRGRRKSRQLWGTPSDMMTAFRTPSNPGHGATREGGPRHRCPKTRPRSVGVMFRRVASPSTAIATAISRKKQKIGAQKPAQVSAPQRPARSGLPACNRFAVNPSLTMLPHRRPKRRSLGGGRDLAANPAGRR
jgi:hypothetical protein